MGHPPCTMEQTRGNLVLLQQLLYASIWLIFIGFEMMKILFMSLGEVNLLTKSTSGILYSMPYTWPDTAGYPPQQSGCARNGADVDAADSYAVCGLKNWLFN